MEEETGLSKTMTTLILLFIGVVVVSTVLIPILFEITGGDGGYVSPDEDYTFTAYANIPNAVFVFDGEAMEYLTVSDDGKTVSGRLSEGKHTFTVTAYTFQPTQVATKTITVICQPNDYEDTRPILLLVPTMMIVGLIVWGLRRFTNGSFGDGGGESHDGYSLGDSGIAGSFKRGFGKR